MGDRSRRVRVLLVGGPMYDPLYARLPAFERDTGYQIECVARLPHPELNAVAARMLPDPDGDLDLLSTHTKYAPSQAPWLRPLDDLVTPTAVADLLPRIRELATLEGVLVQMPRLFDVRLLYVREDRFADEAAREAFERAFRRPLEVPRSWDDLVDVAAFLTTPAQHGFLFPGRDSGLFGTFYEMLVAAGGDLFTPDLAPAFASSAGEWAASRLFELHGRRQVTPRELPSWHYDEVSASFRRGAAAMVADWPGSDYLYRHEDTCRAAASVGVHPVPAGFSGRRAGYGGCHSFAIPKGARNLEGARALLAFLTSPASQGEEANLGAFPVGRAAVRRVVEAAASPRERRRWDLLTDMVENHVIIPPRFAAYPDCEDILWRALQGIITGEAGAREGLAAAAREVARVAQARIGEGAPP
jgi:multiple sugar transport system substrate-binding protein